MLCCGKHSTTVSSAFSVNNKIGYLPVPEPGSISIVLILVTYKLKVETHVASSNKMAAMRGRGTSASSQSKREKSEKSELEDFVKDRDYVGAFTLLDVYHISLFTPKLLSVQQENWRQEQDNS